MRPSRVEYAAVKIGKIPLQKRAVLGIIQIEPTLGKELFYGLSDL